MPFEAGTFGREELGDWQRVVPAANWCDRQAYLERLHEAGFTGGRTEPITDNVYEPLLASATRPSGRTRDSTATV